MAWRVYTRSSDREPRSGGSSLPLVARPVRRHRTGRHNFLARRYDYRSRIARGLRPTPASPLAAPRQEHSSGKGQTNGDCLQHHTRPFSSSGILLPNSITALCPSSKNFATNSAATVAKKPEMFTKHDSTIVRNLLRGKAWQDGEGGGPKVFQFCE